VLDERLTNPLVPKRCIDNEKINQITSVVLTRTVCSATDQRRTHGYAINTRNNKLGRFEKQP
jgi:hypothetical protein